jgi:hypothetical protein
MLLVGYLLGLLYDLKTEVYLPAKRLGNSNWTTKQYIPEKKYSSERYLFLTKME